MFETIPTSREGGIGVGSSLFVPPAEVIDPANLRNGDVLDDEPLPVDRVVRDVLEADLDTAPGIARRINRLRPPILFQILERMVPCYSAVLAARMDCHYDAVVHHDHHEDGIDSEAPHGGESSR